MASQLRRTRFLITSIQTWVSIMVEQAVAVRRRQQEVGLMGPLNSLYVLIQSYEGYAS